MEVLRYITWYDELSNKRLGEFRIDQIVALEQLLKIFEKYQNDSFLYMVYDISNDQAEQIQKYVDFNFNFEKFIYNLDCYQK